VTPHLGPVINTDQMYSVPWILSWNLQLYYIGQTGRTYPVQGNSPRPKETMLSRSVAGMRFKTNITPSAIMEISMTANKR